ncbi:hypothetical protein GCM10023085_73350 [Actinomadura viridis]
MQIVKSSALLAAAVGTVWLGTGTAEASSSLGRGDWTEGRKIDHGLNFERVFGKGEHCGSREDDCEPGSVGNVGNVTFGPMAGNVANMTFIPMGVNEDSHGCDD